MEIEMRSSTCHKSTIKAIKNMICEGFAENTTSMKKHELFRYWITSSFEVFYYLLWCDPFLLSKCVIKQYEGLSSCLIISVYLIDCRRIDNLRTAVPRYFWCLSTSPVEYLVSVLRNQVKKWSASSRGLLSQW